MNVSLSTKIQPLLHIPTVASYLRRVHKEKVVVVVGATGTGKSRLAVDLAATFPAEVINSDKIQIYRGLDIATNKVTAEERRGVNHHLIGVADPDSDFSPASFRAAASLSLKSILKHNRLPIIAGGSNSFVDALISDSGFQSSYDCCFLWVDVDFPVLRSFVSDRVDKMVERGIVEEVRDFYEPSGDYSRGIRRAIGVPEFDRFFRREADSDEETRARILAESIEAVKINTSRLACRQLEKIQLLRMRRGWRMHRLDATEVFRKRGGEAEITWKRLVAGPGTAVVTKFLYEMEPAMMTAIRGGVGPATVMAAAH